MSASSGKSDQGGHEDNKLGEPAGSLAGATIWLTRSHHQLPVLRSAIEARAGRVQALPLFDIQPLPINEALKQRLMNLDRYDLLFFVSTNAARLGMAAIEDFWPQMPVHQAYFAVGPTTAEALEAHGLLVQYPQVDMTSEALLALPALSNIEGRKALIVRGEGGREVLSAGLKERGASVDYAELYSRAVPEYSQDFLRQCLQDARPDVLVVSSGEGLDNLCQLLASLWPDLFQTDLMVSSERLVEKARMLGFSSVYNAKGADDSSIVAALEDWYQQAKYPPTQQ